MFFFPILVFPFLTSLIGKNQLATIFYPDLISFFSPPNLIKPFMFLKILALSIPSTHGGPFFSPVYRLSTSFQRLTPRLKELCVSSIRGRRTPVSRTVHIPKLQLSILIDQIDVSARVFFFSSPPLPLKNTCINPHIEGKLFRFTRR